MIASTILVVAVFALFDLFFSLHRTQEITDIERRVASLGMLLRERLQGAQGANLGMWQDSQPNDSTHNGLYWHRRLTPRLPGLSSGYSATAILSGSGSLPTTDTVSPRLPPLQEGSIYGHDHDLLYQLASRDQRAVMDQGGKGMESFHIPNLRVFIEYYDSAALASAMSSATPVVSWKSTVANPASDTFILPESPGGGSMSPYNLDFLTMQMNIRRSLDINSVCIRIIIQWWKNGEGNIIHEYETVLARRV
jgi:hypothetical protein